MVVLISLDAESTGGAGRMSECMEFDAFENTRRRVVWVGRLG